MPFGNVYLSNPFSWRQHFFKGNKIKKRVKDYYVWGASSRNYNKISGTISTYTDATTGKEVKTTGMSGEKGPTGGNAHPNFIGIITLMNRGDTIDEIKKNNQKQFAFLFDRIVEGHNVYFPIDTAKEKDLVVPKKTNLQEYRSFLASNHGLGKGVARERAFTSGNPQDATNWHDIQSSITNGILTDIFTRLDLFAREQTVMSRYRTSSKRSRTGSKSRSRTSSRTSSRTRSKSRARSRARTRTRTRTRSA